MVKFLFLLFIFFSLHANELVIYHAINIETNGSCKFYEEEDYLQEPSLFKGKCVDDFIEGNSSIVHHNGHRYIGMFHKGYYDGYGKFIWDSENYIEGEFHNNYLTGEGSSYSYGNRVKGEFYKNYFTGYGIFEMRYGDSVTVTEGKKELLQSAIYQDRASLEKDRDRSLALLKKALKIRKVYLQNHPLLIDIYDELVRTLLLKRDKRSLKEAKFYSLKALEIREKIYNSQSETISTAYNNLALILVDLGEFKEAIEYGIKAIKIDEIELSKDDPALASLYANIALTYREIGELKEAKTYLYKSLNIREKFDKNNSKNREDLAIDYNTLSLIYQELGDLKKALEYAHRSLHISKDVFGEQHPYVIEGYTNLSMIYLDMKEYKKAKKEAESSLKLAERTFKKDGYEISVIYNNIALLYKETGDMNTSLKYGLKALKIAEKILSQYHPELGTTYANLSLIYMALNSVQEAKKYTLKALEIREKNYNKEALMMSYRDTSFVYLELKDNDRAFEFFKKAFTLFMEQREALSLLNHRAKRETLKRDSIHIYNLLDMALLYKDKDVEEEIFDFWLQYKGEILNSENLLLSIKSQTKDRDLQNRIDRLIEKRKEYAKYFLKSIFDNSNALDENITKVKEEKEELEEYIGNKSQEYHKQLKIQKITVLVLSQKLKPHQLYIDFAKTDRSYYRFTIDNKNHVSYTVLDAKEVDVLIKNYRDSIVESKDIDLVASKLYKILLKDIDSSHTDLIISPDGQLHLLPFESLYTEDKKYLIQERNISYISSGKALLKAYQQRDEIGKSRDIVVFSHLDYNNSIEKRSHMDQKRNIINLVNGGILLGELIYTKNEAKFMRELFDKYPVYTYKEKNGTKEVLYGLNSPKILHISTHSLFGEDDNLSEDSLLKSVMALSGYNNYILKGNTDGVLSALEFSNLNLYNTELVLFSSCESGMGDIYSAEGVSGLNRGAELAGAKRVISTLWSVSDKESIELTKSFYKTLKQNEMRGYTDALKKAKLEMINRGLNPFYWAGFIEYGID